MDIQKILVIEDDKYILNEITLNLKNAGYIVHTSVSSKRALEKLKINVYNLIIIDVMLPDLEGTKLCELIRKKIFCPIIFIGCINEKYMLKAFIAGGDDYIRKPFSADELVARVKANLRRVKYDVLVNNSSGEKLKFNDLTIDLKKNIVINHNKEVHLTPLEFDILLFMVSNPNTILSYSDIYNNVWKAENNIDNRTVMVHVSNLRKKLKNCNNEKYIKTIKKRGYKFCC